MLDPNLLSLIFSCMLFIFFFFAFCILVFISCQNGGTGLKASC